MKLEDFIKSNEGKLFRYWLVKRNYTPYEWDKKYEDQSELIEDECSYGYFVDCIDLGYDHLIGITEDCRNSGYISYHKLSLMDFAYCDRDQEEDTLDND